MISIYSQFYHVILHTQRKYFYRVMKEHFMRTPKKKLNVRLEDIAVHCGVSISTVSRVINASKPVSKDLELKVKQAIHDLRFTPKRPPDSLKRPVIAFIVKEVLNPATTTIITGAQEEADRQGLGLMMLDIREKFQEENLKLLLQFDFAGIILLHTSIKPDDIFALMPRFSGPFVVLGEFFDSPKIHCINTDRETGMYQVTKYLLSLNHTQISYLDGPPEWELSKIRLKGIQRALDEAGFSLDPDFYRWCFPTIEDGFQIASSILSHPSGKRPTAFIAFNDLVAIGAIHAARTFRLVVPQDISVVGFDNIYLAAHTNPPLTTVAQPKHQIGQLAVQKIANSLNGQETDKRGFTLLECPLVVRESTAPNPKENLLT
jgi:DNA-binding LacI/PurR family transcriptional regulator